MPSDLDFKAIAERARLTDEERFRALRNLGVAYVYEAQRDKAIAVTVKWMAAKLRQWEHGGPMADYFEEELLSSGIERPEETP